MSLSQLNHHLPISISSYDRLALDQFSMSGYDLLALDQFSVKDCKLSLSQFRRDCYLIQSTISDLKDYSL